MGLWTTNHENCITCQYYEGSRKIRAMPGSIRIDDSTSAYVNSGNCPITRRSVSPASKCSMWQRWVSIPNAK